jgi:hypothetical protein
VKQLLITLLLYSFLYSYEEKSSLGIDGVGYSNYSNELLLNSTVELKFENEYFKTYTTLEALYSSTYSDKRYLLLNELYLSKDFNEYSFTIGKEIEYWGELEGYNVADIYNQKNYIRDPFEKSAKYGSYGSEFTRYFDESYLSLALKSYEENKEFPQEDSPYNPYLLKYNETLHLEKSRVTPTLYITANITDDTFVESETKVVLLHGYDTKRSVVLLPNNEIAQYAYRVNKALLLSHIIYNDTIFKTELSYTDVINYNSMSDYTQLSFGVEESFYDFFGNDITLYGEYYRYIYSDNSKIKNVDISELYDNDLFLALRLTLNDTQSSEVKVGILEDMTKEERIMKVNFTTRVVDKYIVNIEYMGVESAKESSVVSGFGDFSRAIFGVKYLF